MLRIMSIGNALSCVLIVVALLAAHPAFAEDFPEFNGDPAQMRIVTDDLDRFWAAWDEAERQPDARREIFQRDYLNAGSRGLQAFVKVRIENADRLLSAIDRQRDYYAALRSQTPNVAAATAPVHAALERLHALLSEAIFPDVYLLIGRMNTGGTIHPEGLLIGVEMYGRTPGTDIEQLGAWHRAVLMPMDELPTIIVHELVHFQQYNLSRTTFDTLLGRSINEGAADFIAELLLGRHINQAIHHWALPREATLWAEFREVMHGQDYADWLYNGANADAERLADLGYFVGYRIAQSYYEQAEDKRAAFREIIAMTDPVAFLEASGYGQHLTGAAGSPAGNDIP
jgi:hypothetical protein